MLFISILVSALLMVIIESQNRICDISILLGLLQSGNIIDEKLLLDSCNMCLQRRSTSDILVLGNLQKHVLADVAPCCTKMPYYGKRSSYCVSGSVVVWHCADFICLLSTSLSWVLLRSTPISTWYLSFRYFTSNACWAVRLSSYHHLRMTWHPKLASCIYDHLSFMTDYYEANTIYRFYNLFTSPLYLQLTMHILGISIHKKVYLYSHVMKYTVLCY